MAEPSKEQRSEIRLGFESGESPGSLSKRYGVPKSTIKSWARREGWVQKKDAAEAESASGCNQDAPRMQPPRHDSQKNDNEPRQGPRTQATKTNRAGVSRTFGVALTTVDSWKKSGCPHDGEDFYTDEVYHWREAELSGSDDQQKLTRERARLAKEQADEKAMSNAETAKQLLRVEELTEICLKVSAMLGTSLDAMLMELKRACPFIPNQGMEVIKKTIVRGRNDMVAMVGTQIKAWMA